MSKKSGSEKLCISVHRSDKERKNKRTRTRTLNMTTISVAGPFGTRGQ